MSKNTCPFSFSIDPNPYASYNPKFSPKRTFSPGVHRMRLKWIRKKLPPKKWKEKLALRVCLTTIALSASASGAIRRAAH